ncbi:MAG: hypothetical protein IJ799_02945 [Bacteroidales bacterium]|nr:hypothetical protein [Bacteroidales bacterium]
MKKLAFCFAALAMVAAACTKESTQPENTGKKELVEMSFTISGEAETDDAEVRAYLNSDRSVSFKTGDAISIFANGTNYKFTADSDGKTVKFTGTAEVATTYYALYPYISTATIDAGVIKNVSIATSSAGTGTGNFNSQKDIAVGVSNSTTIRLKQVCALLKITVPADVTDLKEVVVFCNNQSGTSDAITGTFDVTPSAEGTPTVSVTTAKYQIGVSSPTGGSNPIPAGDYYMPVIPASLTKGLNVKLSFIDGFTGRGFNGSVITLAPGQVYNLGTVKKTDRFVHNSFESGVLEAEVTGNTNAVSVIENPYQTAANPSNYVLCDNMQTTNSGTSGMIDIAMNTDAAKVKFPYGPRDKFDKIEIKVWLGTNQYYPRICWNKDDGQTRRPYSINGVEVDSQATWDATVKTNDWNVLQWRASQWSGKTHFQSLDAFRLRLFVNYDNGTMPIAEGTSNHLVYIDDVVFILK